MTEPAIRYKPRALLEPDERLMGQMHALGVLDPDQHELASALGCSVDTLQRFWRQHPEYKEAFEDGQAKGRLQLRKLLRGHAMVDPGTARFLAKQYLKMSDDPSKAKADEAAGQLMRRAMSREEANGRILELKGKLIGETIQAPRGGPPARVGHHPQVQDDGGRAVQRARPVGGVQAHAPRALPTREPRVGGDSSTAALDQLVQRVQTLEASTVRKAPRKDGNPHTDRTQEVAQPANRVQMGINGGPPLLPGRIQRGKR